MKNLDGDSKLDELNYKVKNNMEFTEQDIMTLSFIPLMSSVKSKSDITLDSIEVANKIQDYSDKNKCLMLLYALFDKFGDDISKKRFKEVVTMTEVGKMIYDEGIEKGIETGIKKGRLEGIEEGIIKGAGKGKSDLLIKQLIKKFKVLPNEYREKIEELSSEAIEVIGTEIFDMESIEELKKYF
ncbi:MAG: DUF4351 domain-containing protein [Clostridium sp.]